MRFEDTEQSRIDESIRESVEMSRVGRVTTVKPHDTDGDRRNHEVNVEWPPNINIKKYRDVPISHPSSGFLCVPEIGDLVLLQFRDGDGEKPIVTDVVYGSDPQNRAPLGEPGIIRGKRDDKYIEMHPDGDWARIAQKSSDDGTPDVKIEINDDGIEIDAGDTDVIISADTVTSNGGGKIVAGEGDTVTGDGHDHGGEVSSDTVTGSIDDKSDGDVEVNE